MESRNGSLSEDGETNQIQRRFMKENVDPFLPAEHKIIHIWRWLTDAETNCQSLNMRLEKVQKQHLEEIEELVMSKKDLEIEVRRLSAELEDEDQRNSEIVSEEISEMLKKQGLKDLACCGVSEQFAFLLVERAQMKEELEAEYEKQHRRDHTYRMASKLNLTDNLKLSSPQIQQLLEQQKDEFEEELKNQQLMVRKLKEELKDVHEKEVEKLKKENSLLSSDINSANKKIEEFVRLLSKNENVSELTETSWVYNIMNRGLERDYEKIKSMHEESKKKNEELKETLCRLNEEIKKTEKSNKILEMENQNLDFKLSEVLYQCSEMEEALHNEKMKARRPSIVRKSSIFESQSQLEALHGLFDRKISSAQQDLNLVDQVKRLKLEILSLQNQVHTQGDKYEILARRHQLSKIRHKERLQKIRELYFKDKKNFDQQLLSLNRELNLQTLRIAQEQSIENQLKDDIKRLLSENSAVSRRMLDIEVEKKDLSQKLELLNHRLEFYKSEHSRLHDKEKKVPLKKVDKITDEVNIEENLS